MKDDPGRPIDAKIPVAPGAARAAELEAETPETGADGQAPDARAFAPFSSAAAPAAPAPQVDFLSRSALVALVKVYHPAADEDLLNRAYVVAMTAHAGQIRKSGEPYFTHPLAVAQLLTELRADPATVATALLHDVVEDTSVTLDDVRRLFGDEIADLVRGVTKLSEIEMGKIPGVIDEALSTRNKHAEQFEQLRRFVVSMADDVRVLLVKLADRVHNMRTLHYFDDREKRERIAQETIEIYAPLAGRIGVQKFREELEDRAFAEISPTAFRDINERLRELGEATTLKFARLGVELRDCLAQADIKADVSSREKRPYSIWRKMALKNVALNQLADVYAFRVIVDKVEDCYRVLGVIHKRWRMVPEEFDDYISAGKPNGYQSIHTAVIGPAGPQGEHLRIEIQIRTREMHDIAERGVAAHWQYKDITSAGGAFSRAQYDPYETPRKLAAMLQQGDDPEEALRFAKLELFHDQVLCFTPTGKVISLPKGATSIDFAYAVHTRLGDQWVGATINGVNMPARTPLKSGDVVRIETSTTASVLFGWEALVVTGRARSALRKRVKQMKFAEHVDLGRKKAEAVFAGAQLDFSPKAIKEALQRLNEKSIEDVLAKVGADEIKVERLVEAAYPGAKFDATGEEIKPAARKKFNPRAAITGLPAGVTSRMAQCCAPVPGERLIGIREDGGSVAVHTIYCEAWPRLEPADSQIIDLGWDKETESVFGFTQIAVTVLNEIGVLSEVAGAIARCGVSIANIKLRDQSSGFVDLIIDLEIKNERQLTQMLAGLRTVAAVVSAERREALDHE